jgi:hypothetical protein
MSSANGTWKMADVDLAAMKSRAFSKNSEGIGVRDGCQ